MDLGKSPWKTAALKKDFVPNRSAAAQPFRHITRTELDKCHPENRPKSKIVHHRAKCCAMVSFENGKRCRRRMGLPPADG